MGILSYLVPLLPAEGWRPPLGLRVRWPGEPGEWVWDGERWLAQPPTFEGGDTWLEDEAA